ncbi:hypothetical protein [Lysobacter gummosus]
MPSAVLLEYSTVRESVNLAANASNMCKVRPPTIGDGRGVSGATH